ncbi:MAG: flagellar hook-basal body complex protein FliE [Phycisphaerae bacterium]|jgi:flagellar hook-basal body complex protein FliE|nr:flagellar hook-basal body complex protein FliE [Phycisphaerae bacterium]
MADPLGIVNQINRVGPTSLPGAGGRPTDAKGGEFREELMRQIGEVNKLQQEASGATQDVLTGKRNDVEAVVLATQKADSAFKMLLAVRNKVMDAYDEVKQMRV